jgi:hypothetical protein
VNEWPTKLWYFIPSLRLPRTHNISPAKLVTSMARPSARYRSQRRTSVLDNETHTKGIPHGDPFLLVASVSLTTRYSCWLVPPVVSLTYSQ